MNETLSQLKEKYHAVSSMWNGKDSTFTDANGDTRTEDEAVLAGDIVDAIDSLEKLIESYKF